MNSAYLDYDPANPTGAILNLQRLSTEDGPGIRTTVFFKGCPLSCQWCHNPESISPRLQMQWLENLCIGCLTCIEVCPRHALEQKPDGIVRNRVVCDACGACAEACPSNAMERLGKKVDAAALVVELLKDRAYYQKSGGGITLSGGEPTLQPSFALALAQRIKQAGYSVALDTCGLSSWKTFQLLLPEVDLILFDLKLFDNTSHEQWTGQPNTVIFQNLMRLAETIRAGRTELKLWIRTPLIPDATTSSENLTALGRFIHENLEDVVQRWELCAFNNLCRDKYRRLDMQWPFKNVPLMTQSEFGEAISWARSSGVKEELVSVTGAARFENNG
jgi:pyruvate formate lyase activating enzyme